MAIQLEYINVVIPMQTIRERLREDYLNDQGLTTLETCWHDEHLFREGCMNEYDLKDILDAWEGAGLALVTMVDGKKQWKDLCVAYSGLGPSYQCEWLEYDREKNIVWLKGRDAGAIAGPASQRP